MRYILTITVSAFIVCFGTQAFALDAPGGFRVDDCSSTTITWGWNDVSGESGYDVFDNITDAVVVADVPAGMESGYEPSLSPNMPYQRYVKAYAFENLTYYYDENPSSTASATWLTTAQLSMTAPPAGDYVVIATCQYMQGASPEMRVLKDGVTEIGYVKYRHGAWHHAFIGSDSFTSDGTSTYTYQLQGMTASGFVQIKNSAIIAIKMPSSSYSLDNLTEGSTNSTTPVLHSQMSVTSPITSDYLLVHSANFQSDCTTGNPSSFIKSDTLGLHIETMRKPNLAYFATDDYFLSGGFRPVLGILGDTQFSCHYYISNGSVTASEKNVHMAAMRLSDPIFNGYAVQSHTGEKSTGSTAITVIEKTFNVTIPQQYLFLASCVLRTIPAGHTAKRPVVWWELDGTGYDEMQFYAMSTFDRPPYAAMRRLNLSIGAHTMRMMLNCTFDTATAYAGNSSIIAIPLENMIKNYSSASNSASAYTLVEDPLDSQFSVTADSTTSVSMSVTPPPNPAAGLTGSCFSSASGVLSWGAGQYGVHGDGIVKGDSSVPVKPLDIIDAVKISGGHYHCLALRSNGQLYAWGRNGYGALGDGTDIARNTPFLVPGITNAIDISAGYYHSLAVLENGSILAWGRNTYGQIGDGTYTHRSRPVLVSGITNAVSVYAGYNFSMAVLEDNTVRTWGRNTYGQLGDGSTTNSNLPVAVSGLSNVESVSAGHYHSVALLSTGSVYSWGCNYYGQLGDGTTIQRNTPVLVSGITDAITLDAGGHHTHAIRSNGTLLAWGRNDDGQLGDGTTSHKYSPVQISGISNAAGVAGAQYNSLIMLSNGSILAMGENDDGQLGDGTEDDSSDPVQVLDISDAEVVSAGGHHSIAILSDGSVRTWGLNEYGQLGLGIGTYRYYPALATSVTGDITDIAAGWYHCLAVKSDGTVLAWGKNRHGEIGDGTAIQRYAAVQVSDIANGNKVAAGFAHSLCALSNGSILAWGEGDSGQLGDGGWSEEYSPVQVLGITNAETVAAGEYHSLADLSNGSIMAWGHNSYGQLGDGTTSFPDSPVLVSGISGAVELAGGEFHSLALLSTGTVYAWGCNIYGQLGDGTTTQSTTPQQVPGISTAIAIAAGSAHSVALLEDGTILAWGRNEFGQLGDGTETQQNSPVTVLGITNAVSISAGFYHSHAVLSNGTVIGWGYNYNCQLGDGTNTERYSPVVISGLSDVSKMAAGYYQTIAIGSVASNWQTGTYSYAVNDLAPNTSYAYKAKLRNGDGVESAWTGGKSVITQCIAPSETWFSNVSETGMNFHWLAYENPDWTTYHVEMSLDGGVYSRVMDTTSLEYGNNSLSPTTRYYYRVRAENMDGLTTAWLYASDMTLGPPVAPDGLLAHGKTNPTSLGCSAMIMSAFYCPGNPAGNAVERWVQIDDDSNFSSPHANAGWLTDCDVPPNARWYSPNYGGPAFTPGVTYYWRVKFKDQSGQEGAWSSETAYFVIAEFTQVLENKGYSLLWIPCYMIGKTVGESIGDDIDLIWIFKYSEADRDWIQVAASDEFENNVGYFIWCENPGTVLGFRGTQQGNNGGTPVSLTLSNLSDLGNYGWHLLRNHYSFNVDWSNFVLQNCDSTHWKPWTGTEYLLFDSETMLGCGADMIGPGESFWVHANGSNAQLTMPDPVTAPAPLPPPTMNWKVRLTAESGLLLDTQTYFGAREGASSGHDHFDILKIRSYAQDYVRAFFDHPDWGRYAAPYAFDAQPFPFAGGTLTWNMKVYATDANGLVRLSWNIPPELRDGWRFYIHDKTSGVIRDMTLFESYDYPASGENTRDFTLTATMLEALLFGDSNLDGTVDESDAVLCSRAEHGLDTLSPQQRYVSDMNGDGKVSALDALLILKRLRGHLPGN